MCLNAYKTFKNYVEFNLFLVIYDDAGNSTTNESHVSRTIKWHLHNEKE